MKINKVTQEFTEKTKQFLGAHNFKIKEVVDGQLKIVSAEGRIDISLTFWLPGPLLLSADIDGRRYTGADIIYLNHTPKHSYKKYLDNISKIRYEIHRRVHGNII